MENNCEKYKKDISSNQILGEGVFGTVYNTPSDYVLKYSSLNLTRERKKDAAKSFNKDLLRHLNKDYDRHGENDLVFVPRFQRCGYNKQVNMKGERFKYKPGDMFLDMALVEYVLGLFINGILDRKESTGFIRTISTSACPPIKNNAGKAGYFIGIEKADGSLKKLIVEKKVTKTNLIFIVLSIFQAIETMCKYQINHSDLHLDNILYKKRKNIPGGNGTNAQGYVKIKVNGTTFTFKTKSIKYYPRIADFGWSAKFSHPQIINCTTLNNTSPDDGMPDYFEPKYDFVYFLYQLLWYTENTVYNEIMKPIGAWLFFNIEKNYTGARNKDKILTTNGKSFRFNMRYFDVWFGDKTIRNLLKTEAFKRVTQNYLTN